MTHTMSAAPMVPLQWAPPTVGQRWDGDDGESQPPIASLLEEMGCMEVITELEANEVYTLETLMLLTDADIGSSFSGPSQAKIHQLLGKSSQQVAVPPMEAHNHPGLVINLPTNLPPTLPMHHQPAPMCNMGHNQHGGMPIQNGCHSHSQPQPGFVDTVQQLVEERERSRRVKDYIRADAIREQLRKQGIKLNDDARTWLHPNGMIGGSWGKHDVKVR